MQKTGHALAIAESEGKIYLMDLLRIIRIWRSVSIVCFIVTAVLSGYSIYTELHHRCQITLLDNNVDLDAKSFTILASAWVMLAVMVANTRNNISRIGDALRTMRSVGHTVTIFGNNAMIYIPFLLFGTVMFGALISSFIYVLRITTSCE